MLLFWRYIYPLGPLSFMWHVILCSACNVRGGMTSPPCWALSSVTGCSWLVMVPVTMTCPHQPVSALLVVREYIQKGNQESNASHYTREKEASLAWPVLEFPLLFWKQMEAHYRGAFW